MERLRWSPLGMPFWGMGRGSLVGAVDQEKVGRVSKIFYGLDHGFEGGLQDVDPVDFGRFDPADPHGRRHRQDFLADSSFPLGGGEKLGVPDSRELDMARQNHRSSHNRPGQRAAAHLVDPRNQLKPRR